MPPTFDMALIQRCARLRRSPYFEATLRAGCRSYTVYNHMFLPHPLRRPPRRVREAADRGHGLGRERRAAGGDHRPGRLRVHQPAHPEGPVQVRGRPGQVRPHRRPRTAVSSTTPCCCGWARITSGWRWRTATCCCTRRAPPSIPASTSTSANPTCRPCRSRARSRRKWCGGSSETRCRACATTGSGRPTLMASPWWVTRTGWSGEVGYEIYLRDGQQGCRALGSRNGRRKRPGHCAHGPIGHPPASRPESSTTALT